MDLLFIDQRFSFIPVFFSLSVDYSQLFLELAISLISSHEAKRCFWLAEGKSLLMQRITMAQFSLLVSVFFSNQQRTFRAIACLPLSCISEIPMGQNESPILHFLLPPAYQLVTLLKFLKRYLEGRINIFVLCCLLRLRASWFL